MPIVNLLDHVAAFDADGGAPDQPAQVEFVVFNDGADEVFWVFHTEVLDPLAFAFFVEGQADTIFSSPFASREQKSHASQGPVLTSELFVMAPGEQLTIRGIFEKPPGPELFPISVISRSVSEKLDRQRRMTHGIFLGAMAAFVVLFLLSPNFLMNAASNWFGAYLVAMTLLNLHSHGYTFALLDVAPETHFPLTRLLHTCLMLFYLLFVLSFLKAAKAYPVYWRSVWVFIIVGTTIALLEQILQSAGFQSIANLVPLVFLGFGFWGAYLAVRDRVHGAFFFMTGFAVLVVGGWLNFMASLPSFASWNQVIDQVTLFLQTADALIFGAAILNQIYGLRDARDRAVTAQLEETQRRLEVSTKLLSTEGDLRRARELAERHRANLASTSHDLRQPIVSLRTSLEVAKDHSPELVSELSAGIQFLDRLLEQTLAKTRPGSGMDAPGGITDEGDTVELQVIVQNAQRMFALEAAQKGINLKVVETSLAVRISTIDLIRMVSNLTANAVRYTPSGSVLIGVRRRNGRAAVEVWDTGSGVPTAQMDAILQPYHRGGDLSGADGEGLGLSIVKQLAERNDLQLNLRSIPGKGSVFAIDGLVIDESADAAEPKAG